MADDNIQKRIETLGPAERIVQVLTTFTDHLYHGRPGMVVPDGSAAIGVRWEPVTWRKQEDGTKAVFRKVKGAGKKVEEIPVGVLCDDNTIREREDKRLKVLGEYRTPGIYPEVAAYLYRNVADVFQMDNEFVARWGSWAALRDHRDAQIVLGAFLLVQNRKGEPVLGAGGEVEFYDEDYRDVAEALCLIRTKNIDLSPKSLLRIGEVLRLPQIRKINQDLGFSTSGRRGTMGRYPLVVKKWLHHREMNIKMLKGLVQSGQRRIVMSLARSVGYKPDSEKFFEVLRWRQKQALGGHRTINIGKDVQAAETWDGLTEAEICQRIVAGKLNYKRVVGLVPSEVGITRAIVMATVEAGGLSDADLVIGSSTWEDLGLTQVPEFQVRWQAALDNAKDRRAANIAKNVRTKEVRDQLEAAADKATAKAIEKVTRNLRTYFIVDKSISMENMLDRVQANLAKFVGGFPLDRIHVSVFNTMGREIIIKSPTEAGVRQAFRGHSASGGTLYAAGVRALAHHKPLHGEDALMIFAGDEEDYSIAELVQEIQNSGINPVALAILPAHKGGNRWRIVRDAAASLGIPCLNIDDSLFDDPYSVTRTLTNLIATTPTNPMGHSSVTRRKSLIEEILEAELLTPPLWAKVA